MFEEWPRYSVMDLQNAGTLLVEDGNHGEYRPRHEEFGDGDWAFIRAADMDAGRILFDSAEKINDTAFARIRKGVGKGGDVLFSHKGTVGKLALAPMDAPPFVCSPQTTFWRTLDEQRLDRRYLYYFMQSRAFANQWMSRKGETDMADYVSLTAQRTLELILPSIDEQRAIADVLAALDDKIEQNRRTSAALERVARAMFRAWFVDFEPVKAKAAGAAAFPAMTQEIFDAMPTRLVDSELGPVPEGWDVKPATAVAAVAIGKTPPRKEPQWFSENENDVRWVSIADMGKAGVFIRSTSECLTTEAVERFHVRRIPTSSVLYSFKLTLGRVAITDGEMTSNEAIAHFVPNDPDTIGPGYLYCYLSSFDHQTLGSTSSIATATNSKAVKALPVIVPGLRESRAFTETVRPLFYLIRQQTTESSNLAVLRDYLLPKLLSGAVGVGVNNA